MICEIGLEHINLNLDQQITFNDLPIELIREKILPKAPQLGTTCKQFHNFLPHIDIKVKKNIMFPLVKNDNPFYIREGTTTYEYQVKIDFKILNKLIDNSDVQGLNISTVHPIFLEIKKFFEIILESDQSIINSWKYKDTFLSVYKNHYDSLGNKKLVYVQMNWINSFVTSFIMYLSH